MMMTQCRPASRRGTPGGEQLRRSADGAAHAHQRTHIQRPLAAAKHASSPPPCATQPAALLAAVGATQPPPRHLHRPVREDRHTRHRLRNRPPRHSSRTPQANSTAQCNDSEPAQPPMSGQTAASQMPAWRHEFASAPPPPVPPAPRSRTPAYRKLSGWGDIDRVVDAVCPAGPTTR